MFINAEFKMRIMLKYVNIIRALESHAEINVKVTLERQKNVLFLAINSVFFRDTHLNTYLVRARSGYIAYGDGNLIYRLMDINGIKRVTRCELF